MNSNIPNLGTAIRPLDPSNPSMQPSGGSTPDFAQTLRDGMHQIEKLQGDAEQKSEQLLSGGGQDIHSALIAVQKAELSFQLMMQVRNKIVQAYQEISKMSF